MIETHKHAWRDGDNHLAVCGFRGHMQATIFDDKVTCPDCRKAIRKTVDSYRKGISPSPELKRLEAAWAALDAAA